MKKIFILLIAIIFISISVFGQYSSWNGSGISPCSKFRTFNLLINIYYDVSIQYNDSMPGNSTWPALSITDEGINVVGKRPPDAVLLNLFDTVYDSANLHGEVTRIFGESSFDSLQITGDFIVVNLKESTVTNFGLFNTSNMIKAALKLINDSGGISSNPNVGVKMLYGHNSISDYDFENNNRIYCSNVFFRNLHINYGAGNMSNGGGQGNGIYSGDDYKIKINGVFYKFSGKGSLNGGRTPFVSLLLHEIGHSLLGGNAFHTSGGNHRHSQEYMPFFTLQHGYGLMSASGGSLVSCNGYDRWRLHWKKGNSDYYIGAHNSTNSQYVNSDIKKEDGNQTFILRDFVSDGDVVRIKLPYKDSEAASNQYIWLENHKIGHNNKLDYLAGSDVPCRPQGKSGIFAYYQIGRDILSGSYANVFYQNERDNLKMITAEGFWNFSKIDLVRDTLLSCINWAKHGYTLSRETENPFCGFQDLEKQIHIPATIDILTAGNAYDFDMWFKSIGNSTDLDMTLPYYGDTLDAFTTHCKINMGTNPSTCNAKTYYNYNYEQIGQTSQANFTNSSQSARNNQTTYLTGLSIEMIPQTNYDYKVNIRWDDYDISNSARWTGKIANKEIVNLTSGNTIELVQNKTLAQHYRDTISGYFAKTTLLTCEDSSHFTQQPKSHVIVAEKSKLLLKTGSEYIISDSASLTIKQGCFLEVEDCAVLVIKGKLIIESGAGINFHQDALIDVESLNHIIGNIPVSWSFVNPKITVNTQISQPQRYAHNLRIANGATLTLTSTIEMAPGRCIFVEPGSKLIVDGGKITSACAGKFWNWICVEGDRNQPQTEQYQGVIELKNGAIIENARTAISTSYNDGINEDYDYWNKNGGIIRAENTTFRNNRRSVELLSYTNHNSSGGIINNVSYFKDCNFITDSNFFQSIPPSNKQVTMWEVRGVTLKHCNFVNTSVVIGGSKGVYTFDAGYSVKDNCTAQLGLPVCTNTTTASSFSGYITAIESSSSGAQYPILIGNTNIYNSGVGIYISVLNNFKLLKNNINQNVYNLNFGIYCENTSGYKIEENNLVGTFDTSSDDNALSYGFAINNSGMANNKLYKNDFSNILLALVVDGVNCDTASFAGLQFFCNKFENCYLDFLLFANSSITPWQGTNLQGAGNRFINTVENNLYSDTYPFTYFYSPATNNFPNSFSPNVQVVYTPNSNTCASTLSFQIIQGQEIAIPIYKEYQTQYDSLTKIFSKNNYAEIIKNLGDTTITIPLLIRNAALNLQAQIMEIGNQMYELSNGLIDKILNDSVLNTDNLKQVYETIRTPIAKYSLAETHFMLGEYDDAKSVLALIPNQFNFSKAEEDEHANYIRFNNLKTGIYQSGRNWTNITDREKTTLRSIRESTKGRSSSMANGVLCFFYDDCQEIDIPDFSLNRGNTKKLEKGENSENKNNTNSLYIYPNPANESVEIINLNPENQIVKNEILTTMGQLLKTDYLTKEPIKINLKNLEAGIYLIKTYFNNGITKINKIIIK